MNKNLDLKSGRDPTGFVPQIKKRHNPKAKSVNENRAMINDSPVDPQREMVRMKNLKELLKILEFVDKHYSKNEFTINSFRESASIRNSQNLIVNPHESQKKLPVVKHKNGIASSIEKDLETKSKSRKSRLRSNRNSVASKDANKESLSSSVENKKSLQASKYILLPKYKLNLTPSNQCEIQRTILRQNLFPDKSVTRRKSNDDKRKFNNTNSKNQTSIPKKNLINESTDIVGWDIVD